MAEITAYYLWSYEHDIQRLAQSARGHWGIENSLHWSVNVGFNEDQSRIRKGFASASSPERLTATWKSFSG